MKLTVINKQKNSKRCFLCGLKNPFGLHGMFYELENNELLCLVTPKDEHQSYPGRLHGGIATALLDETIGRAILMHHEDEVWGVTIEFTTKYIKPIPLEQQLKIVGRVTNETSRSFEGTGEIFLPDGEVAATGHGIYLRMPLSKITNFDPLVEEWKVVPLPDDPHTIELGP
jgi:uncharacterized protein (TIGR00369 family)